jgi:TolB protein
LLDLESSDSRLLVPETVLAFFWSPDGRSIAYLTLTEIDAPFDFDDAPVAVRDKALVDWTVPTTTPSKIKTLSKTQSPPDDSRLGLGLWVVEVDSGEKRQLTVFEPSNVFLNQFLPFFDQYALSHRLWSPDSEALVVPMQDDDGRDFIVVVPVDGSEPVTIAHGVAAFWSHQ